MSTHDRLVEDKMFSTAPFVHFVRLLPTEQLHFTKKLVATIKQQNKKNLTKLN